MDLDPVIKYYQYPDPNTIFQSVYIYPPAQITYPDQLATSLCNHQSPYEVFSTVPQAESDQASYNDLSFSPIQLYRSDNWPALRSTESMYVVSSYLLLLQFSQLLLVVH